MTPAGVFRRAVSLLLDAILAIGLIAIAGALVGVRPYVVESGSMEPSIPAGSVCLINARARYDGVRLGDVVCFESAVGKKVIHRVTAITEAGIETKGDANANSDGVTTTRDTYIGTVLASVAGLGFAVYWLQTPRGMILCIAALLILFILAWEPAEQGQDAKRAGRRGRRVRAARNGEKERG